VLGDGTDAIGGSFSRQSIFLVAELLFQRLDGPVEATLVCFPGSLWM
jgi:hypothetical protein